MFKAATIYTLPEPVDFDNSTLSIPLFEPMVVKKKQNYGFVPPAVDGIVQRVPAENADILAIKFEDAIIPPAVINQKLANKIAELGRQVPKRERLAMREDIEFEMLQQAFTKESIIHVLFTEKYLIVGTASQTKADEVVCILRGAFGSLKATPLATNKTLDGAISPILNSGSSPEGFSLGDKIKYSARDTGANASFSKINVFLSNDAAYETGDSLFVSCVQLLNEKVTFILKESLQLSSIKYTDEMFEETEGDVFASTILTVEALVGAVDDVVEMLGGIYEG